jgi:hypothetical protein
VHAAYRTECPTGAAHPLILYSSYSSTLPPVHFIRKFYIGRTNESCSHHTTFVHSTTVPSKSIHGFYKFVAQLQEIYLTMTVSIITCFEENVKIYYMKTKTYHSCFDSHMDLILLLDSFLEIPFIIYLFMFNDISTLDYIKYCVTSWQWAQYVLPDHRKPTKNYAIKQSTTM